jgi:membrane fusion protein (multidrug efflux system)
MGTFKFKLSIFLCALLLFIGVFVVWRSVSRGRNFASTDNAYVGGNQVVVNSQIAGTVIAVGADNTFLVEKGHLLVALDPTDQTLSLTQAMDRLGMTCRNAVDLFEAVRERKANMAARQAVLVNSWKEFKHREVLLPSGAVALEDFENSEASFYENYEQFEAAEAKVDGTTVMTHPMVLEAVDSLKEAYVNRKRCKVVASTRGLVAQRNAQIGQWVAPQTPLMTLIPLSEMWVDANFREVDLKKVRIGQKVEMFSDLYGKEVIYHGRVVGIGGGSGSVFSVLPPQNATGNWVKIVQRVPVRIALDPRDVQNHPLRLGLSMTVTVHVRNDQGPLIPEPLPENSLLYQTDVFGDQEDGVGQLIYSVFNANIPKNYL